LYLDAQGKAAAAAPGGPIEKLVSQRRRVLALDLRGMGETAPSTRPGGIFGSEYTESFLALHLNRPLLGQRVYDLLSVLAALPDETRREGIELIGTGPAGLIALHAAVLDDRVKAVTIEQTLGAWSDVVKTPQAQRQLAHIVPGVLAAYDLPDLCASLAPRPLTIRQPADARGEPLSADAAARTFAPVRIAYERRQQGSAFELITE
jgi:pimeloyl-ACP methyl ester carboxylesterase